MKVLQNFKCKVQDACEVRLIVRNNDYYSERVSNFLETTPIESDGKSVTDAKSRFYPRAKVK